MSAAMEDAPVRLSVPDLPVGVDALTAALLYAEAGWYLVPVRRGTKNPGSVLGDCWPALSSRNREVIVSWFAGTDHGIALHVGRSGAVVFDIDHPEKAPITLRSAERECSPPTQRTRADDRRHLVFTVPPGRTLSNQRGRLGLGWGEVRGTNGVIVVAPSVHPDGGHYRWTRTGLVPQLPQGVADMLPDAKPGEAAADSATVAEFARTYATGDGTKSITGPLRKFHDRLDEGDSRHEALVAVACWACREAKAGAYAAAEARARLREVFILSMAEAKGEARLLSPAQARFEFDGMWSWAVGQALAEEEDEEEPVVEEAAVEVEEGAVAEDDASGEDAEPGPGPTLEEIAQAKRARLVAEELEKLEVRDEAKRRHARNNAPPGAEPGSLSLAELLKQEDEAEDWRIEGLCPTGGKVLIAAPQKTGKTTLMVNLVRALADGDRFLAKPTHTAGEWRHTKHAGFAVAGLGDGRRVFLLDNEMTPKQLRRWYQRMGLADPDRVHVQLMRGRTWDIRDQDVRAGWAARMREVGTDILVVDPIGPVMHALGIEENNNTEVGGFLAALDALVAEAGISELFAVHHAGHSQERARGASAFQGWPDANWRLVRDDQGETRAFGAEGRDVFERETVLVFDRNNGRLWLGEGSRADMSTSAGAGIALEAVQAEPGIVQRDLEECLKNEGTVGGTAKVRAAIEKAVEDGVVHFHRGGNRSKNYHKGRTCGNCPETGELEV